MEINYRGRLTGSASSRTEYRDPNNIYRPVSTKKYTEMSKTTQFITAFNWTLILIALASWWSVINYYERSSVRRTIQKCSWDKWETWDKTTTPHRIALFADPQIMDDYSYPDRPAVVNFFSRQLIDNYHKRNWAYVNNVLDADTTIFLGDLFDGGRNWNDSYWFDEFKRFNELYYQLPNKRYIMSLPGNHDIGFGETVEVESLKRFRSFFGPTSSIHEIGNHTIVLLDSISLSDYSTPEVQKEPREILSKLEPFHSNEKPRILLQHVPMFRDPKTQTCGPLRESKKPFPIMKGLQYQTVIDHELTHDILQKIRPKIVFSGDDHDYCHIKHSYIFEGEERRAEEITVKSCSMNMGIQLPAIQLLSLNTNDKSSAESYQTQICYLPAPYTALKAYIAVAIINALFFVVIFLLPKQWYQFQKGLVDIIKPKSQSLPIAEINKPVSLQSFDRNWGEFLLNGLIVIAGVIGLFTIFFNAF